MPSCSKDDHADIYKNITALEENVCRLEVNAEVCKNETTLPLTQNSRDEQFNWRLKYTTFKQRQPRRTAMKYWVRTLPGIVLVQIQKVKFVPWKREGSGSQAKELKSGVITTGLHSLQKDSRTTETIKTNNILPEHPNVKQQNRFAPLLEDLESLWDNHPSQNSEVRSANRSERRPHNSQRKC